MVKITKCDGCIHKPICAFKSEYEIACKSIENVTYSTGTTDKGVNITPLTSSKVIVAVSCPHLMAQSQIRTIQDGDICP